MGEEHTARTYRAAIFMGTIIAWIVGVTIILIALINGISQGYSEELETYIVVGSLIVCSAAIGTVFARNWLDDVIEVTM